MHSSIERRMKAPVRQTVGYARWLVGGTRGLYADPLFRVKLENMTKQ